MCLRCSGQHRQLQVHIAKIKSVNLDAWKPEMVEMYKHFNNAIVNAYWEAKLPKGYNKPVQGASSSEVESFIRDKYVNKRWIDTKLSADPVTLYNQDRKKFERYVKGLTEGNREESEEETEKKHKKHKKSKKSKKDRAVSESEEEDAPVKSTEAPKLKI